MSDYGACRRDSRLVAVEGSAAYSANYAHVPDAIVQCYGGQASAITFLMLLRDPVHRIHSEYYHSRRDAWCHDFLQMSFKDITDKILSNQVAHYRGCFDNRLGPQCGCFLESSMYKDQLEHWFATF